MRKNLKAGSNVGGEASYHHVGGNSAYHHGQQHQQQHQQQQQAQLRQHFQQHHQQQPDHHHQHHLQHPVNSSNGQHYSSMAEMMSGSGQPGSMEQMHSPPTAPNESGDVMFHSDGVGAGFGTLSRDAGPANSGLVAHPSSMSPGQQQLPGVADHPYPSHAHGNHSADYQQHHGNIYSRQASDHHQQHQHPSHNPAPQSAPGAPPHPHQQPQSQAQPPHPHHQHQVGPTQSMQHHAQHQHQQHPSHSIQHHHGQHPQHHYSRSQVHGHNGSGHLGYHPNSANHHGPIGNMATQSTVMMVYGLQPDRINCDRLFNLFCLYGNVAKVSNQRTLSRIISSTISTNLNHRISVSCRSSSLEAKRAAQWFKWAMLSRLIDALAH